MSLQESLRFEQISPKSYEHPTDRAATAALHSIPLMDMVIKRLVSARRERLVRQIYTGNAVQISDKQVPQLWSRYCRAAYVLDIAEVPDLFITQTPSANAMTIGAKRPIVIVYSGLVKEFASTDVDVVLAHELGHVLSEHYYYQTMPCALDPVVAYYEPKWRRGSHGRPADARNLHGAAGVVSRDGTFFGPGQCSCGR